MLLFGGRGEGCRNPDRVLPYRLFDTRVHGERDATTGLGKSILLISDQIGLVEERTTGRGGGD